jgi:hypothetical protein
MNGSEQGEAMHQQGPPDNPPGEQARQEQPRVQPPTAAFRGDWKPERFSPFEAARKSPALASVLSLAPGLGQVYVGYYQRGFVHILVVASIITTLAAGVARDLTPALGIFLAFFWLYNIVDAGRRAALYNLALDGATTIKLPDESSGPGGGSVAAGILLITFGGVFLAHTQWNVSMRWLADWWPLAPIAFGVWLIFKSMQERAGNEGG